MRTPRFITTPRPPVNLPPDCTEQGDWSYSKIAMDKLGIPCFALFFCVSFLNLSLMWTYIAMRSKSMKKGKANLSKKLLISIVVISGVFGILEFVAFGILQNQTIGAGMGGSVGQGGVSRLALLVHRSLLHTCLFVLFYVDRCCPSFSPTSPRATYILSPPLVPTSGFRMHHHHHPPRRNNNVHWVKHMQGSVSCFYCSCRSATSSAAECWRRRCPVPRARPATTRVTRRSIRSCWCQGGLHVRSLPWSSDSRHVS